jgi:WD repeat-containing protein 64
VFNCWPMTRTIHDTLQLPHTHERPLVALLYNQTMNQIATVCSESVLKVWESDTGNLIYSINDIHDKDVSVTCMCIDSSGYRLATAGVNNSIKIWDFGAGQELKHKRGNKQADKDYCIKNMCYNKSQNSELYLICFGWNNKIKIFHDTSDTNELLFFCNMNDILELSNQLIYLTYKPLNLPESVSSHANLKTPIKCAESSYDDKHSILSFHYLNCSTFCKEANLMLTGGNQGEIFCWNLEKREVEKM